jgi:DNA-directed RNA polymerase specialized sigma24 family protein
MLSSLVKIESSLLKMAKAIDFNNHNDLLQDTYIKLHDSGKAFEDIDMGYIYLTMRSIFINRIRKEKDYILVDDFSRYPIYEAEKVKDYNINKSLLNALERIIIDTHYGKLITTKDNIIIKEIEGKSLLRVSRESGVSYRTLYSTLQKIKLKLCKDLETQ